MSHRNEATRRPGLRATALGVALVVSGGFAVSVGSPPEAVADPLPIEEIKPPDTERRPIPRDDIERMPFERPAGNGFGR